MKRRATCAVVVVERGLPVGLVTDRDLVTKVLAKGRAPGSVRLLELCGSPIVTMAVDEPPAVAARLMREHGTRWLVVVGPDGRPVGVLTVEDLFARFARQLGHLSLAVDRLREPGVSERAEPLPPREAEDVGAG